MKTTLLIMILSCSFLAPIAWSQVERNTENFCEVTHTSINAEAPVLINATYNHYGFYSGVPFTSFEEMGAIAGAEKKALEYCVKQGLLKCRIVHSHIAMSRWLTTGIPTLTAAATAGGCEN